MPKANNKSLPPFSLSLTPEERVQLDENFMRMPLSTYIRSRLFNESQLKRRIRNKHPVKDHQELAKVLAELDRSRMANNLKQLAKDTNSWAPDVTLDTENPPECLFGYSVEAPTRLLKTEENEHVEILELNGFFADDLQGS